MEALQLIEDERRVDLDSLVRRHQGMVWRYLRLMGADPIEADDLMQETFLRVPTDESGGCRIEAPEAFLRAVARNLLLSARRAADRRPPTVAWSTAVDELVADNPSSLEDGHLLHLRRCISRLSPRARRAVELHYLEGESYRGVARTLRLRANGVRTLLARARQLLRDCLTTKSKMDDEL